MSTTRHKLTKYEHKWLLRLAKEGPRYWPPSARSVVGRLVVRGLACWSGVDYDSNAMVACTEPAQACLCMDFGGR